jgi:cell wall-associated NlpC family hydrolase
MRRFLLALALIVGALLTTSVIAEPAHAASAAQQRIVAYARAQVGKPYRFGAAGPRAFDCSGLVQAAYKSVGRNLPHSTYGQWHWGHLVTSRARLQPGDLVFTDRSHSHVQIYAGNGYIIEASRPGRPVIYRKMWGFVGGRHIVG